MTRPLDIVIPVCNEEGSIDEFCARMDRLGYGDALIFVDNASTDGTLARLARYPKARVLRHATNEGYGASIRDGMLASDGALIVIIDADLEYPPEAVPSLIAALQQHPVVYTSRFLGPQPPAMPLFRRVGNRLMSGLYNVLFRQRVTDLYTGMKGLRRDVLPISRLRKNGFEHCTEIAAMIAIAGHHIHEVPIDYRPRQQGASKMRHLPETLKLTGYILAYWVRWVVGRG